MGAHLAANVAGFIQVLLGLSEAGEEAAALRVEVAVELGMVFLDHLPEGGLELAAGLRVLVVKRATFRTTP